MVSVDELIKCTLCIGSSFGQPDLMQCLLRFRLYRLRKRIQHIRTLVHPATLVTGVRINLIERRPKPQRTVANRKLRHVHPTRLQIQQHLASALRRLANPVFNRQKLLLALIIHAGHHQLTQLDLLSAQTAVNPIHPQLYPSLLARFSHHPRITLCFPLDFLSRHHLCGKSFGFAPQQHSKHFAHLAVAEAFQIQPRQKRLQRVHLSYIRRVSQERIVTGAPLVERTLGIFTVTEPMPV